MLFKKRRKELIRFDCREVYKSDCNDCMYYMYYGSCNKRFISNKITITLNNLCVVGSPKSIYHHMIYLEPHEFRKVLCYLKK